MSNCKIVWTTPDGDNLVAYMARVSNPSNQDNMETAPKLIKYLLDNGHWSPLEMVSACIEINTWRDIGRQILRHRSFAFQEFSQRYAKVDELNTLGDRECRLQDSKNRQNSLHVEDENLKFMFKAFQDTIRHDAMKLYEYSLSKGIAKEVARILLPEGLTPSRMYMTGSLRSWVHYLKVRLDPGTQKEHREIAEQIRDLLKEEFPLIIEAAGL